MNSEENPLIKQIVSLAYTVADEQPELLDTVLTDQVLIWAAEDLGHQMSVYSKLYITNRSRLCYPFEYESKKELVEQAIIAYTHTLLVYYKKYKIFSELLSSRNIEVKLEIDPIIVEQLLIDEKLIAPIGPLAQPSNNTAEKVIL